MGRYLDFNIRKHLLIQKMMYSVLDAVRRTSKISQIMSRYSVLNVKCDEA